MKHLVGRIGRSTALALIALLCGCGGSDTVVDQSQRGEAARLNLQLAIDYFRQGQLNLAKEKLDRSLEQDNRNPTAHATAGLLYDRLGEVDKGEMHYERAVSLDDEDPDIHNNFAVFLCRHGKHARGEKEALLAAANPLYKTPEAAFLNAGVCARGAGDMARAEQYFRRALAVQPRFSQALLEMADVELRGKNYLAARAFLERYNAVERPNPASLWLGVRIEKGRGNHALAGDYARRLKIDFPTADETKQLIESERQRR
jgi:type IV pilus assembly protein PilF